VDGLSAPPANGRLPPLPIIASTATTRAARRAPTVTPTKIERRPRLPATGGAAAAACGAITPLITRVGPAAGGLGGLDIAAVGPATVGGITGGGGVGTPAPATRVRPLACPKTPRRAWANEAASGNRSAGFLAIRRRTIVSSAGGIARLNCRGKGGAFWTCCMATAIGFSASNGNRPVSISKRVTPSAYRSARGPASWPRACSGER
jgi:hypothetical protein